MADDMVLFVRLFDLLAWLVPRTESFPRPFRHSVTQRLLDAALDCQDAALAAQAHRSATRRQHLAEADAALSRLRLYLRLAHHWHWLNDGQYEHASRMVAEIGRLLGGWIRQQAGSAPDAGDSGDAATAAPRAPKKRGAAGPAPTG